MAQAIDGIQEARTIDARTFAFPLIQGGARDGRVAEDVKYLIEHIDTSAVTSFNRMLYSAEVYLYYANISPSFANFDTRRATSMREMFAGWSWQLPGGGYASLDLTSFDTSKVTDFYQMLYCAADELDISSFDTSAGTTFTEMFGSKLTGGYIRKIVTGAGWTQAGASRDADKAMFPSRYRDESGTVFEAGSVVPDGAHTYTKV